VECLDETFCFKVFAITKVRESLWPALLAACCWLYSPKG